MNYKAYVFFLVWITSSWCNASSLTRRMTGGTKVSSKDLSFQVLIILEPHLMEAKNYISKTTAGGAQCGGAIISEGIVLTAAHCVPEHNHEFYSVTGKIDDPADRESEHVMKLNPTEIVAHKEFDKTSLVNDIAIIKVQSSHGLEPIKLGDFEKRPGYQLSLASWGTDPLKPTISYLRKLPINVLDDRRCIQAYGHYYAPDREICAMGEDRYNTFLAGDSGSPVLSDEKKLVGIISYNVKDKLELPGALTDVSYHKKWIQDHLKNIQTGIETKQNPNYNDHFENEKNAQLGSQNYSPSSNYYISQNQNRNQIQQPQYSDNQRLRGNIQREPTPSKRQEDFWSRSSNVQGGQREQERMAPRYKPNGPKFHYQAPNQDDGSYNRWRQTAPNQDDGSYNRWRQRTPSQHNTVPQSHQH